MPDPSGRRMLHRALEQAEGTALRRAALSDQQRLAVVLQGAALLAHLEHGGWILADGWTAARVDAAGLLHVDGIRRGRDPIPPRVLLRRLLRAVFRADREIAGRGEARRAARQLLRQWQTVLVRSPADAAVAEILEAAPFLWAEPFGAARTALLARHVEDPTGDAATGEAAIVRPWIAGPGAARRRFLGRSQDPGVLEDLLAGPAARDLWEAWQADADPTALAASGQWRRAAAAWQRRPPGSREEIESHARCLLALGRYSGALAALKGQRSFAARVMRLRCQVLLGELAAAAGTLRRLDRSELTIEQQLEVADAAVRLLAARGQHDASRDRVARTLAGARGHQRLRAALVAAEAAWDRGDTRSMERWLDAARGALEDPDLAGRWHHVRGLRSIAVGDGSDAVEHVTAALRYRRRLLRPEAGRLWNDLAVARVLADDLPGAERAVRHAVRLLTTCEGPSRLTLALYNLAEVRLRRGRSDGVAAILEASAVENRRAGNVRGLIRDLELWVRLELAQGRATAALARCAEARAEADEAEVAVRGGVFDVFAARAHGWLGHAEDAAALLAQASAEAIRELEPEERPALWAQAGDLERAAAEAAGGPWAAIYSSLVADLPPSPPAWDQLHLLEPFRAARMVYDAELIHPGAVPTPWVRRAIAGLRRHGAGVLAEDLESRSLGTWRALGGYLRRPAIDEDAAAELLAAAGYPEARLSWDAGGEETVVISGRGGGELLTAARDEGSWILRAAVDDPILRTLFALLCRDLPPPRRERRRRPRPAVPGRDGTLGESPALKKSLFRLDRLAAGRLPILILGESGTGKELAARRAHLSSPRSGGPFLAVNCAALSETLIQSDLFGHVRGSFTSAERDHVGVFESARGGTVFLDEIGDLPLPAQGKLLRVLQEGEIRRVGESFARKVDVRVVAATHRALEEMVARGEFREDLFFRLKVATVTLPPLRDRGRDLHLLAEHFLRRFAADAGSPRAAELTPAARSRLLSHDWPGNIRELRNVLEVAATLAGEEEIEVEDLDLAPSPGTATNRGDYHQQVESFRRRLVKDALEASGGNRSEAARRLGLSRQALSYLVKQLGL